MLRDEGGLIKGNCELSVAFPENNLACHGCFLSGIFMKARGCVLKLASASNPVNGWVGGLRSDQRENFSIGTNLCVCVCVCVCVCARQSVHAGTHQSGSHLC